MGQAGFSVEMPPRHVDEEAFEKVALLRYKMLDHGYEFFFDLYTLNSIFKLGFLEYFCDLFSDFGILEYGHLIIVIGYIFALFLIYILGCICRILPLGFYGYGCILPGDPARIMFTANYHRGVCGW